MNQDWQTFLQGEGGVFADNRLEHFGQPAQERISAAEGTVLVDLSHLALIRARGADVVPFLQGQLSNDIRLVDDRHSQLTGYSSPKGRMFAILRVFRHGEDYLLQLPETLREGIVKRLRMFVMRSRVTLESADDLVSIGLSGPQAPLLIQQVMGATPSSPDECLTRDGLSVLKLPGLLPRFEIVATPHEAIRIWRECASRSQRCAPAVWAWLDIMAGIPTVLPETSEAFVPQMANLELIGGVNFKKGCYPGQEIVARMQYLGRLKQRMVRAHADMEHRPMPGADIHAPDFGEQSAGTVVDAQPSPRGGYDLLAVVQIGSIQTGELYLGNRQGARLSIESLPYALPDAQTGQNS
jgi:folate-binding protein YgfZ